MGYNMIWIGIGLSVLSLLIMMLFGTEERCYAFTGFLVGLCVIAMTLFNFPHLTVLLITLGILMFLAALYLTSKVVGGPWNFGFSPDIIPLWIVYAFFQFLAPAGLIVCGIIL